MRFWIRTACERWKWPLRTIPATAAHAPEMPMNGKCWQIGSPDARWPSLLEQAACARGLRWCRATDSSSALSNLPADRGIVIAIAADHLAALAPADEQRIGESVAEGAML